jgi:RimJ/RimL family protein N-acetyltransferase
LATEHRPERGDPAAAVHKPVGAVLVERITHLDVPAICSLYKKVWEAETTGLPAELVKSWQPTPLEFTSWMEGVTYFAARRDGHVVGVIGCELEQGSCQLVALAVDPELRRQGVGSSLLAAALDWAKHSETPEVWAEVLSRFTAAGALLAHLGFKESGVLHKHQWREDVRLFERLL